MTGPDFLVIADILREIAPLCKSANQFTSIVSVFENNLQRRFPEFNRTAFDVRVKKD